MPTPRLPPEHDDDELDELPPIDGDLGEGPESSEYDDDVDDVEAGDLKGQAVLDDATGEDDPVDANELGGLDSGENEANWLGEASDSPELDLGDPMLLDAGVETLSLEDGEDEPSPDEDFGVGEGGEGSALDAAEEGPIGADDELRDEDLPALDADDGPEPETRDDDLIGDQAAGDEPLGVPWAAEPWVRVGPPAGLVWVGLPRGITALACASRGALVAGRAESGSNELVRVDLEGARQVVSASGLDRSRLVALASDGDTLAAVSDAGAVLASFDGGEHFESLAIPEGVAAADVVIARGVLWVRTRTGSLLAARRTSGRPTLERRTVPGSVVALCNDGREGSEAGDGADLRGPGADSRGDAAGGGGMVALAVDESGRAATLVRGQKDGTVVCEAVRTPGGGGRAGAELVARGGHVASLGASPRSGVLVRAPDGTWRRLAWEGRVTAIALVDDRGTLVAATYSETDDSTGLVRVDAAGTMSLVARLGAARDDADADGRVIAMVCDDPRGVVWVAGGFGVAAFTVR